MSGFGGCLPGYVGGVSSPSVYQGPVDPDGTAHPVPEPTSTGAGHARTQAELLEEELQQENAGTALDQPSDASGGE